MTLRTVSTASESSQGISLHSTPTFGRSDLLRLYNPCAPQHFAQFYERDRVLVENVCFVSAKALAANSSVVHIATEEHRAAIGSRLAYLGLDIRTLAPRCYLSLDAEATLACCMAEGWPDQGRFEQVIGEQVCKAAEASENGFVFLFGEMVGLLCAADRPDAAVRLEQLWNALNEKHRFSLYCGYPLKMFDNERNATALSDICAEHSLAIPAESVL